MTKQQTNAIPALRPADSGDGTEGTLTVYSGRPTIYSPELIDKTLGYLARIFHKTRLTPPESHNKDICYR